MSPRDHAEKRTAALRKVRRMTGIATGGAALTAVLIGGVVATEIPGASSTTIASAHSSARSTSSTATKTGSGSGITPTTTSPATAPTTTTTSPTVVSGGTS